MRTPEEQEALFDRMESFLNEYAKADEEFQTNQRRDNWKSKYQDKFKPYEDKLKKLNGDDFDLMEESRKEYETQYSDLSDDEYCNALETNIKATLQRIWPDAEPEQIEQATEEVKEAVEEPVEEPKEEASPEDTETTTTTEETVDDEGNKEVEVTEETKPEEDEEESDPLEDFTKELEEEKAKTPKRK